MIIMYFICCGAAKKVKQELVCFSKEDLRAGAGWSSVKTGNMFTAQKMYSKKVLEIHFNLLENHSLDEILGRNIQ